MSSLNGPVGLWTSTLDGLSPGEAAETVAALDEQGWDSLWCGEAYGREAFTAAQWYLGASRRMAVGTGIASIYGRDALAAAAAGRTLHAAYGGRFLLGLGVSHAPLVERLRGHDYGRPLAAMRAYLDALDAAPALVAGESEAPPRLLAALGPRMLELARDRAQGAHPYLVTPEHTARAREILGGAAGETPAPLLVVEQAAVVDPAADRDPETWRSRARAHLEIYTGLPNYRASWRRQGFTEEDFVRGGSPRLAEALVTRGLDATRARVREHLEAGATSVVVQVLGADAAKPPVEDWARLAEAVL
ncbi:TIGR03620 family F420-dependent LLM class oxidoreductase [Streptomyces physcomitrii]|uniref:TIGR03620 family F420-dependent LLM class oxidoreductase n=1 Tax=Streptomyces physcomitrii TaxID=2724184 RepID=A0ABX1H535_9ACTN|nr:TIGR03620 family F420-dependent LLM class oxidoreductase [Streptomyces physcomitrii]NKI43178.1 TIGR03620 family F420-dependent LLM class oxidoreductase [Streptomyces physcomitrii]